MPEVTFDTQAKSPHPRRNFLRTLFGWAATVVVGLLFYPLLKYTRYKVKPQPRYITVKGPLPAGGYHAERDFILFSNGEKAHAVSRTCTHLGCRVQFLEDKQYIECPCHQSRFSSNGERITGPAERNLPVYAVEIKYDTKGEPSEYVVELI